MTCRFPFTLILSLSLALGVALPAAAQVPEESGPRYVFVPVNDGALRLNTGTGEVSLCAGEGGAGVCAPVADKGREGAAEAAALQARLAALEARIAALESRGPVAALSDEASMDRVMVLADRLMRRFVKLIRDVKEDAESGAL